MKLVGEYLTRFDSAAAGQPNAPKKSMGEIHQLPDERPDFSWRMRITAFIGENMPRNDVIQGGEPSCYLEFGWSDTDLNRDARSPIWFNSAESVKTIMVENTTEPSWNQQLLLHNPLDVLDHSAGFFIIKIMDFHRNTPINQAVIPMGVFVPFRAAPIRLSGPHASNPTQHWYVKLDVVLEVPIRGSGTDDRLVVLPIKWAKFDPSPPPNVKAFSLVLASGEFNLTNEYPFLVMEAGDTAASVESVFAFHNQLEFGLQQSPWQFIPPSSTETQFNAIAQFILPNNRFSN